MDERTHTQMLTYGLIHTHTYVTERDASAFRSVFGSEKPLEFAVCCECFALCFRIQTVYSATPFAWITMNSTIDSNYLLLRDSLYNTYFFFFLLFADMHMSE